ERPGPSRFLQSPRGTSRPDLREPAPPGSGLNLVVAAIVLWNTVYLDHAVQGLRKRDQAIPDELLEHLSPLGWEHINLTGDYVWKPGTGTRRRPLRQLRLPLSPDEPSP